MTRARLLRETDALELGYWRAKEAIDGPIGDGFRDDLRAAMVQRAIYGAVGASVDVATFMPDWSGEERPEQSYQEMRATWQSAVAAANHWQGNGD